MTKFDFPPGVLSQHIAVLGKTRSGKSSVMRVLTEHLLEEQKPVCIIDPKGDWWGIKLARDGRKAGYPVVIFGGEHADVPINAHSGAAVAELFATGNRPCLIDLGGWMVAERTRFWIDFSSTLFRLTKGMRWLVVDEIHNFAPKGKVMDPDAGKALHWANRLASEGLGKGLHMVFASQRPQKVHNDTLTSAETLIAMRVLHPSDRGAVSDWVKGCGDLVLGEKVLNSLAQMDRGEGWVWSPEIGFGPQRVKFPLFRTYDSFRPQTADDAGKLSGWAAVDLAEVTEKLAVVVKEAQENDPKTLRRRIAELEREVATKKLPAPVPAVAARSDDAMVAALRLELASVTQNRDALELVLNGWHARARKIAKTLLEAVGDVALGTKQPAKLAAAVVRHDVRREASAPPAPLAAGISAPQQRILDVLAQFESLRVQRMNRSSLATMADASPTSSSYGNNLGRLRTLGLIDYPAGGFVALSTAGREKANTPERAPTLAELHESWCRAVSGPQAAILRTLISIYPASVEREGLAADVGASASSSSYGNNLGALRTLGVIDYPSKGAVRATAILFPEGVK